MNCVNYNIIKEGDLRNVISSEVTELDFEVINALYDNDPGTPAISFSGTSSQTLGLLAEFGEAYDICHVDYHTTETEVERISIKYGTTSGTSNLTSVSLLEPGIYRGTINSFARFVEVRHLVSGTLDINQLEVIAFENETLGFGDNKNSDIDHLELKHATVGILSASPNVIPVFNDNHFDDIARVAVAPTFTDADRYLHLSTSSSGTYYGIDDFGFSQPGPNHIPLVNDPMNSDTELHPQWERRIANHRHKITPSKEGLVFDLTFNSFPPGGPSGETVGIISKEFFTATSFTAEVEIRFPLVRSVSAFDTSKREIMFVLGNGYPLPDVGYPELTSYLTDGRRGTSTAGIVLEPDGAPTTSNLRNLFRFADGFYGDNPRSFSLEEHFTEGVFITHNEGPRGEVGHITMEGMWNLVNDGVTLGDLTDGAAWHKWRISYDHVRREISTWVNNIFIGSRVMRVDPFREGCRLFIGSYGNGGMRWETRNFKITPDTIYRQRDVALDINSGVASATISGTPDNVSKLNDDSTSTAYVGPEPTGNAHIRIDFDEPQNVTYYSIKQRSQGTGTSAFGKTYFPDVARTAIVDFGGKFLQTHHLPNSSSHVRRTPTYSGTVPVASGISYVDFQFVDYDRTSQPNGALVIEDLIVYAEDFVDATPPDVEEATKIPWIEGRWRNLQQYGDNTLSLRFKREAEVAYWPVPEYMQQFVDYGFSSAVNGRQFGNSEDFHHSESLFSSPGATGAGDYTQWHSAVQPVPDPFFIWRYFDTEAVVGAVFFNSDTLRPSNVADEFKFQYLKPEGDPNVEADWIDIPPVTIPYTTLNNNGDHLYKRYKDYLIANNDGEFYTSYFDLPDDTQGGDTGFGVGGAFSLAPQISESVLPNIGDEYHIPRNNGPANGLRAYVEFDEPVATRGLRLVVKNPTIESGKESGVGSSTPGVNRFDFALDGFRIISTRAEGSYTSPVFDTGTRQNTERIKANIRIPENSNAAVFIRSSSTPPESAYDTTYETWRSLGDLGDISFSPSSTGNWNRAIPVGDKIYFVLGSAPFVYYPKLDLWSQENGTYPATSNLGESNFFDDGLASTSSPAMIPDDRVVNPVVFMDNVIYVAAFTTNTQVRIQRLMKLDLNQEVPGWEPIPENRPPQTERATMVAYNGRLYFFNEAGPIFYYDVALANWIQLSVDFPVFGGTRRFATAVTYKGEFYFFGGNNAGRFSVTIFDPESETFRFGADSPKEMHGHQAVLVEEEKVVYVLPHISSVVAHMKYFIEEDRWEFAESMMWRRDLNGTYASSNFYFYYDKHIYGVAGFWFKALVVPPEWQHGKFPELRDPVWGSAAALSQFPWKKLDTFGELMPQEQYFQFKVELYSEDRTDAPVLESVRIVLPQSVEVPASGTSNIFLKVGVSSEVTFQALYSGNALSQVVSFDGFDIFTDGAYSILYTESGDGLAWNFPVTARKVQPLNIVSLHSFRSPWVVQNSIGDYEVWYSRRTEANSSNQNLEADDDIYYTTTSNLENLSENASVLAINDNTLSQSNTGVLYPCVVKESPTSYKMWYTGIDGSDIMRIFYAESTDGAVWSSHQRVINIGEDLIHQYDSQLAYRPSVILEDGVYRMWYTGRGSDGLDRILHRTSTDGIDWSLPELNLNVASAGLRDQSGASRCHVIFDSGTYFMYYFGLYSGVNQLIRAESSDGFIWGNFQPAFPPVGLHGTLDGRSIGSVFVLVNREPVIPGNVITTGRIKIHNEGASL